MSNWTAIFKTGTHTDSGGHTRNFTRADLDKVVDSYDPADHEAPLVIGHPKDDAPAYGWVKKLKRDGEVLLAQFGQVAEEIAQKVSKDRFKKKSMALYPDGSLRHVGLLGAMPPAVKGLGDVAFKEGEDWREFEFSESTENKGGDMSKELQQALKEKAEAEAKVKAAEEAKAQAEAKFAEADNKAKAAEEAKAKTEAEFAEHKKVQEAEAAKQAAENREAKFSELIAAEKALPGEKDKILAVASALAGAEALAFSEGGKETTESAEDVFWQLMEQREGHGLLGEFAQAPAGNGDSEVDYTDVLNKF